MCTARMGKLKIGLILGSTREGRVVERVAKFVRAAIEKEHEVVVFDPLHIELPKTQQLLNWFGEDLSIIPENIRDMNRQMAECDAIIALSAEYYWSIPPSLANIVDNIPPATFNFKPCAIITYSATPIGGWRSGMQLRSMFGATGCTLIQKQMGIPVANEALDSEGQPKDGKLTDELNALLNQLYWLARALNNHSKKEPRPSYAME